MPEPAPVQPDIEYRPDDTKYHERTARRLEADPGLPHTPLPDGFPKQVSGPIVWEGSEWTDERQWVYPLSPEDLEEIHAAMTHFKDLKLEMGYISKETFPLPNLSKRLHGFAQELYSGRGFFILRTIPVEKYSREELVIIYSGISSHIGSGRGRQSGAGAVIEHIKDLTISHAHEHAKTGGIGYSGYTTDKQVFHTDIGDLIALLVLETAAEGGTSWLSSSGRIYNELAATRPDLVKVLSDSDWPLDSFGGDPGYTTRPLLFYESEGGHIVIQFSRRLLTGYGAQKRSAHIPPITEAQAEALDAVHFIAEKYSLGFNLQKGDIQFINNLGLVHARDGFTNSPEKTRHLVRLWLRNDELAWKTPGPLQRIWTRVFATPPDSQRFPLEPEIRKKETKKAE